MQRGEALRHEVIENKSFDQDSNVSRGTSGSRGGSTGEDRSVQSNMERNSNENPPIVTGKTLNRTHSSTDSLEMMEGLTMSASFADLHAAELDKGLLKKLKAKESGERKTVAEARSRAQTEISSGLLDIDVRPVPPLFEIAIPLVRSSCAAVVDDSFTRCFKSKKKVNWNWNCYLFPIWCMGVLVRYFILFPLRLLCLVTGFMTVLSVFPIVKTFGTITRINTRGVEAKLIQLLASSFVISWSGVIRMRGLRPKAGPNDQAGIFVANHSSMIDFIILLQTHPYAVVGQKHAGWVGFLQDYLLGSLNCVWFDRGSSDGKNKAAEALTKHVNDPKMNAFPALIFPEGTCVNNEYVMQFRKYVFELGVPIHPVAIKYNKIFVDGYWNSREESFAAHLLRLMTSWAMVCDVWFMETQHRGENESGAEFATRVQRMIAKRAGIKAMDWDGYMKYWKPSERFLKARQKTVADDIKLSMNILDEPVGSDGLMKPSILKKHSEPSNVPKRAVVLSEEPARSVDIHDVSGESSQSIGKASNNGRQGKSSKRREEEEDVMQTKAASHQVNSSVQDVDLYDVGMELEEGHILSDSSVPPNVPQKQNSLLLQSIMANQSSQLSSANAH